MKKKDTRPHKPEFSDKPCGVAYSKVCSFEGLTDPSDQTYAHSISAGTELLSPSLYIQQAGRVYRHEGDPRKMRDRIREIDVAIGEMTDERASLVAKLKAEGFVLIQSDEQNSVAESAHQDIAQQDMSDPANWRVGDVVEIVGSTNDGWLSRKGRLGNLDWDDEWRITFNGAEVWYVSDNTEVKWHSRPPQ